MYKRQVEIQPSGGEHRHIAARRVQIQYLVGQLQSGQLLPGGVHRQQGGAGARPVLAQQQGGGAVAPQGEGLEIAAAVVVLPRQGAVRLDDGERLVAQGPEGIGVVFQVQHSAAAQ